MKFNQGAEGLKYQPHHQLEPHQLASGSLLIEWRKPHPWKNSFESSSVFFHCFISRLPRGRSQSGCCPAGDRRVKKLAFLPPAEWHESSRGRMRSFTRALAGGCPGLDLLLSRWRLMGAQWNALLRRIVRGRGTLSAPPGQREEEYFERVRKVKPNLPLVRGQGGV